jgi:hypothetical protein
VQECFLQRRKENCGYLAKARRKTKKLFGKFGRSLNANVIARSKASVCAELRGGNLLYKYLHCFYFKNQIATAHASTQFHLMGFAMTLRVFF